VHQVSQADSDELFEMANLFPRTTGLPMIVWVSPRGNPPRCSGQGQHDPRRPDASPTRRWSTSARRHVIARRLSPDDQRVVFERVSLNTGAIVEYWDGQIDAVKLHQLLKRLP
jgi:hypothetical protein